MESLKGPETNTLGGHLLLLQDPYAGREVSTTPARGHYLQLGKQQHRRGVPDLGKSVGEPPVYNSRG